MENLQDIGVDPEDLSVSHLQQLMDEYLPKLLSFGIKVLIAIVVFYVGTKIIRWLLKLIRTSLQKAGIDTGVIQFTCSFSKAILYMILVFNIATNFGVKESSVAALLASAGVTLGVGLQGGLANLAGGIMILVFKPFQIGDYIIESGKNCEGTVAKIEICYTTLATVDNKKIVIPNGSLSNNNITNVTAKEKRRLEIKVDVSYKADLLHVKETLERLLREDPDILSEEELVVFVDSLGQHSVVVGFRAWVKTEDYWPVRWRMNEKIKLTFDEEGIEIPYPQMDVHVRE